MNGLAVFCGLGAHPPLEATLETLRAIDAADEVFTDAADPKVRRWLKGYAKKLIVTDDPAAPARAARTKKVCVAVWGHPIYTSAFACAALAKVRAQAVPSEIVASLSPISSAFCRSLSFFGDTYGHTGMRAYPLAGKHWARFLPSHIPLTIYAEAGRAADWRRCLRTLAAVYGSAHVAHVFADAGPLERKATLAELAGGELGAAVVMVPPKGGPRGVGR